MYIDAYKLTGTRLWRIDLGPNIRAGAHYTQFIVYRLRRRRQSGDGGQDRARHQGRHRQLLASSGPAANDDDTTIYRNGDGYVLSGPEYLTVFNGQTGAEMATVDFDVPRGTVSSWGDDYGNRVDRFLATAAYLDDTGLPSFVMARGYYTRTTLTAWNFRDGAADAAVEVRQQHDAAATPPTIRTPGKARTACRSRTSTTTRSQELIYGAMAVDNDGTG